MREEGEWGGRGVSRSLSYFLSLLQGLLCSKTLGKCFLGKWLHIIIMFILKELMGKLAWVIFDWLGPSWYLNKLFCRWAWHAPWGLQGLWVQACRMAPALEGQLQAAEPAAGPAKSELPLGKGPGWSRAKRGDRGSRGLSTHSPRAPREPGLPDPRPPTGQASPRNQFWSEMTFYFPKWCIPSLWMRSFLKQRISLYTLKQNRTENKGSSN